jgi:prevent-host-death family protein
MGWSCMCRRAKDKLDCVPRGANMDHEDGPISGAGIDISLTEAKAQLTEIVRKAEAGEHVYLTRRGQRVAQVVPIGTRRRLSPAERLEIIRRAQREAAKTKLPGPDAAHSQDHLYDERGLPA